MTSSLAHALEEAGVNTAQEQFYVACTDTLRRASMNPIRAAGDSALRDALVKFLVRVKSDMEHAPAGGGHAAADHQPDDAPAAPTVRDDGGQVGADAQKERAPASRSTRGGPDQNAVDSHGLAVRPVRALSKPKRGLAAMEQTADISRQCVLDTFHITLRQGSRQAFGDVLISTYPRLAAAAEKRGWVGAREAVLLRLADEAVKRIACVPDGAMSRDVFDTKTVEGMISEATQVANTRALIKTVNAPMEMADG